MDRDHENKLEIIISLREKTLGNSLILRNLIRFLDLTSLKNCRLVCSTWAEWATHGILRRDCTTVILTPEKAVTQFVPLVENSPFGLPTRDLTFDFSLDSLSLSQEKIRTNVWSKIDLTSGQGWLDKVHTVFPEVTHITLRHALNVDEMLTHFLTKWPECQTLRFDVQFPVCKNYTAPAYLDSILSGLPRWHWEVIRASKYTSRFRGTFTIPPENCCLTRLKRLTIDLVHSLDNSSVAECPISNHCLRHLLDLNPSIQIKVRYKDDTEKSAATQRMANCLEPLKSLVEIVRIPSNSESDL